MTSISIDSGPALLYGYDGRGNMTSTPDGTAYAYDAMDRLIDVDLPDTTHIDYTYDWDGRRIQKDVDSGTEIVNYLWDEFSPFGDVVLETDGTNTVLGNYTLANGQLISQTRGTADRFYLADGQGSIRALVDDAATVNVTDNYAYTAFGEVSTSNETTENAYQYTGQQYDELTGLYSLRARYYSPNAGRFLSRDKLSCLLCDPIELNRYVYAANNPLNMFDPTGYNAVGLAIKYAFTPAEVAFLQFFGGSIALIVAIAALMILIETVAVFSQRGWQRKKGQELEELEKAAKKLGLDLCTHLKNLEDGAATRGEKRKYNSLRKAAGCKKIGDQRGGSGR